MIFVELFRLLHREGVRYLVVGGVAANLHGAERMTMDVDIMLALDPENLRRFQEAIRHLNLKPANPLVTMEQFCDASTVESWIRDKHMRAFQLRPIEGHGPSLDILVKPAVPFETAYARRVMFDVEDFQIAAVSAQDLITPKSGEYDYSYERTDEQLLHYSALPAIAKLRWLDDALRFTMMGRQARRTYYRDGRPTESVVPEPSEVEPGEAAAKP